MIKGCLGLLYLTLLTAATSYEIEVGEKGRPFVMAFHQEEGSTQVAVEQVGDGCAYTLMQDGKITAQGGGGLIVDPTEAPLTPTWHMRIYDREQLLASVEEALERGHSCFEVRDDLGRLLGKAYKERNSQAFALLTADGKIAQSELNWPQEGLFTILGEGVVDPRVQQILAATFTHQSWDCGSTPRWLFPAGHDGGYRVVHRHRGPHEGWTTIVGPDGCAEHIMRCITDSEPAYVTSHTFQPASIHDCRLLARPAVSSQDTTIYEVYGEQERYLGYFIHYWTGQRYRIDLFNPSRTFIGTVEWTHTHEPLTIFQVGASKLSPCTIFSQNQMQIASDNRIDERLLRMVVGYVMES